MNRILLTANAYLTKKGEGMLLSLLMEKNIIEKNAIAGKVNGICWQKGLPCLLQCSENTFSADKVKLKGDVVCDNLQQATPLPNLQLGKLVYDTDGKLLGSVQDVELTVTLKVKSVTLDNDTVVLPSKIVANNDIITVRTTKPKRAKKKIAIDQQVAQPTMLTDVGTAEQIGDVEQVAAAAQVDANTNSADAPKVVVTGTPTTPPATIAPKRKSGDFSFLVGKRVDKNICNFWGELMIREGEVVTREVYLKARTFGKLTELCLHTK